MKIFSRFNNKGFTLIELLAVIAIIAILAALGLASYSRAQMSARNSRAIGNVKAVQNAMEQYYAQAGNYGTGTSESLANCPTLTSYYSGASPTGVSLYCDANSYTVCTTAVLEGTQRGGNSSSNTSLTTTGTLQYFCATNLQ